MSTPLHDWEIIASREPFFGVIATEELRAQRINADARRRFYASGDNDVAQVLAWFDEDLGARPAEGAALDVGCGVGRLSHALARVMPNVVGYDVSESMIRIAKEGAPANLALTTEFPDGRFTWINSYIVFQHIPPAEGLGLLARCLDRADAGAFASVQITAWRQGPEPGRSLLDRFRRWRNLRRHREEGRPIDPLIQMYDYNLSDVFRCFVEHGFGRVVLRHTGHGLHHGAWFLARKA